MKTILLRAESGHQRYTLRKTWLESGELGHPLVDELVDIIGEPPTLGGWAAQWEDKHRRAIGIPLSIAAFGPKLIDVAIATLGRETGDSVAYRIVDRTLPKPELYKEN